ncbi:STN domain-containing protein [Vreelandella sp. EE22]
MDYAFPAQRMDIALQHLAQHSGCFIDADWARLSNSQAPAVRGNYRPEEALWELLKNSGWEGYTTDNGLQVNQREQTWVNEHTKDLRARIEPQEPLSGTERQAYLDELNELERSVHELAREQGFISAGERASYQRSVEALEKQLIERHKRHG